MYINPCCDTTKGGSKFIGPHGCKLEKVSAPPSSHPYDPCAARYIHFGPSLTRGILISIIVFPKHIFDAEDFEASASVVFLLWPGPVFRIPVLRGFITVLGTLVFLFIGGPNKRVWVEKLGAQKH